MDNLMNIKHLTDIRNHLDRIIDHGMEAYNILCSIEPKEHIDSLWVQEQRETLTTNVVMMAGVRAITDEKIKELEKDDRNRNS